MFEKLRERSGRSPRRYAEQVPSAEVSPSAVDLQSSRSLGFLAFGSLAALVGAAGAVWGLIYLRGALEPGNATNPFREIGVAAGAAASLIGAVVLLAGLAMVVAGRRRGRHSSR